MTVSAELLELLAAHLSRRGLGPRTMTPLVFVSRESGEVIDYAHRRQRVWQPATKAAGVERVTFHDLRRANATALVAEYVDVKTPRPGLATPTLAPPLAFTPGRPARATREPLRLLRAD